MDGVVLFSSWLKEQRKEADLTQRELAQAIGCSEITVKKLESGKLRPSKSLSRLLAEYFKVAPEEQEALIQLSRSKGPDLEQPPAGVPTASVLWQPTVGAHNLPAPINSFVGRAQEIQTLTALLLDPEVRLITITGAPGVGKTRLALELGTRLQASFEDSVRFVPLTPVASPELVAPAIERALGLSLMGKVAPWVALHRYLRGKRSLLVLDNFEHLLPVAVQVSEMLTAAPGIKVIVTSRQALDVYGEYRFELHPFALPSTRVEPVEDLLSFSAVQLFVDRARSSSGDFALTQENAQAVVGICERLDGLPLAIELAAGHARSLPPQDILRRLEDSEGSLGLLAGGPRNLHERQRALSSALEWSYNLLDAGEKKLFRAISMFTGSWNLDAIHAVSDTQTSDTSTQLQSLIDKSLLRQYRTFSETRYYMLSTLREFARARAREHGETEMLRRQHANYYLRMAELAEANWIGPEQGRWTARLEENYGNLNAALEWALDEEPSGHHGGHAQTSERQMIGLRLCAALSRFWRARGLVREGRKWLERALPVTEISQLAMVTDAASQQSPTFVEETLEPPEIRVKLLYRSGDLAAIQGDAKQAFVQLDHSLALARRLDDKHGVAAALNGLGVLYQEYGDLDRARALYEESLLIARELSAVYSVLGGAVYTRLASFWTTGEPSSDQQAPPHYDREVDRRSLLSLVTNNLAGLLVEQGEYASADQLLEESMAIKKYLGDRQGIARTLVHMGKLACARGQYAKATELLEEGMKQFQESRDKGGIAWSLRILAYVEELTGQYEKAQALVRQGLVIYREMEYELLIHLCLLALGRTTLKSIQDIDPDSEASMAQLRRAACLLGAAERLRELQSARLLAVESANYEQALSRANNLIARLDAEAAWQAAWQQGRAMTSAEAVAYALQEADEE